MHRSIRVFFLLLTPYLCFAQSDRQALLLRSTLSSSGGSFALATSNSAYLVQQSMGQLSPINSIKPKDQLAIQGFIQPYFLISAVTQESDLGRIAVVFPNPFKQSINLSFLEKISTSLAVSIYTLQGQLIYSDRFAASQRIEIRLPELNTAQYILRVQANNQQFNRVIIKN
jgi:hypothetical protein